MPNQYAKIESVTDGKKKQETMNQSYVSKII
jgi:hypothetical protein